MIFLNGIRNGLREITGHPVRSLITMVGLVCGVASLIAMIGLVHGLLADWRAFLVETGGLEKVALADERPPQSQLHLAAISGGRTERDAIAIEHNVPGVTHVSPEYALDEYGGTTVARGRRRSPDNLVYGVLPDVLVVNRYKLARGRFVTPLDGERARRVIVLGSAVAKALFAPSEDPLGQTVTIEGQPFKVIGLLQHYEFMQGGRNVVSFKNEAAMMPLETALKRFGHTEKLTWLNFRVGDIDHLSEALSGVQNTLMFTHRGVLDFRFKTQEDRLNDYRATERRLQTSIGGVAGISLFIGGIVVMNIMLASAKERVREIGVRKSLGARRRDIFMQLMAEALTISALSGVLGVAAGAGLIHLLTWLLPDQPPPVLLPSAMLLGFAASLITGLLAGLYPAVTAARLDPIDALQYE
jgi:ABC-type antimicrobial peptide transport system permease subunit